MIMFKFIDLFFVDPPAAENGYSPFHSMPKTADSDMEIIVFDKEPPLCHYVQHTAFEQQTLRFVSL